MKDNFAIFRSVLIRLIPVYLHAIFTNAYFYRSTRRSLSKRDAITPKTPITTLYLNH